MPAGRSRAAKWVAPEAKAVYRARDPHRPGAANPRLAVVSAYVRDAWVKLGFNVERSSTVPAADLATRLRSGEFTAAVVDIAEGPGARPVPAPRLVPGPVVRLEPERLPGSRPRPAASRPPGRPARRRPGPSRGRPSWAPWTSGMPILPITWADEVFLARGLEGPSLRILAGPGDRFGDVLAWRLAADR